MTSRAWVSMSVVVVVLFGCNKERSEPAAPEIVAPKENAKSAKTAAPPESPAPEGSALPTTTKAYFNDRFGFGVDVPTFLVEQPAPDNDDGRTFVGKGVGKGVELRAWGMHAVLPIEEMCAKEPGSVTHQVTKTTCFSTGIKGKQIYWERKRLSSDVFHAIRLEYPESMKAEMDPIVGQIYKSWTAK